MPKIVYGIDTKSEDLHLLWKVMADKHYADYLTPLTKERVKSMLRRSDAAKFGAVDKQQLDKIQEAYNAQVRKFSSSHSTGSSVVFDLLARRSGINYLNNTVQSMFTPKANENLEQYQARIAAGSLIVTNLDAAARLEKLIPSYTSYFPTTYCPIAKKELVPTPPKDFMSEGIECSLTKKVVAVQLAHKIVGDPDEAYVSFEAYDQNVGNVQVRLALCSYESRKGIVAGLYPMKDMITVYDQRNRISSQNVAPPSAVLMKTYYDEATGRHYNFDKSRHPFYVWNQGFVTQGYLDENPSIKFDPDFGAYVSSNYFEILNKSNNVLDYFDGFLSEPYEEVVRSSKKGYENTLFMGVELEVEMKNGDDGDANGAAFKVMKEMKRTAITCDDGSLDSGFEIISVPATLAKHYSIWESLLRTSEVRHEITSFKNSTTGIHVHMSKDSFTSVGLGKFMTFINLPDNRKFMIAIAQRESSSYAPFNETVIKNGKHTDIFRTKEGRSVDKYSAVNLCKPHTVEIRIFKGTLHYPSVMKNLEFLHALHTYSHTVASCTDLSWKTFVNWLKDTKTGNRKAYPFLFNFLKERQFIPEELRAVGISEEIDNSCDGSKGFGNQYHHKSAPIAKDKYLLARRSTVASRSKVLNSYRAHSNAQA